MAAAEMRAMMGKPEELRESGVVPAAEPSGIRIQGNWKRRVGVATRYELGVAIDRLLDHGKVEIDEHGMLRLAVGKGWKPQAVPPEERWAREDDRLRAFCQQMQVHETPTRRHVEEIEIAPSEGAVFEASVFRSAPRRGVGKYVLRELRRAGSVDYAVLIETIFERGGLEWVLEEPKVSYRKAAKGAKARKVG